MVGGDSARDEAGRKVPEGQKAKVGQQDFGIMHAAGDEPFTGTAGTWRALIDATQETLIMIDRDGIVLLANKMVAQRLGKRVEELVGTSVYNHFPPDVAELRKAHYGRVVATGEAVRFDSIRAGRVYDEHCYPVFDEGGEVSKVLIFAHDITSRKEAERKILESEERYRVAIESSNDGVVILKGNNRLFYNRKYLEILGYDNADDIDKVPLFLTVHPDDRQMVIENARRRQQGEPAPSEYECRMIRKDGSTIHVEISASIIADGGEAASLGYIRDITDRKRAETALRESEERYRTAIEYSHDGVKIVQDEKYLYVNQRMAEMCGYASADEVIGQPVGLLIHPDDRESVITMHRQRRRGEPVPARYEARHIRKDGTSFDTESSVAIITYKGEPASLAYVRDITHRKRMEEERIELERRLFQTQKLESLGVLAGGIAHDFNNLLMGIEGYASLMRAGMEITHPHYRKLGNIEELVHSGADLTSQLLGFARGGKYEVKTTDMNALIVKSSDMFMRTKREVTIRRNLAGNLLPVDGDHTQMTQVLLNLYLNAWQAMPEGGEIILETANVLFEEGHVTHPGLKPGRYAMISVTDTGIGMDEATLKRIFEPFFTTRETGQGSGLGLASAYGIIKHHGGIIEVTSEKGHGSTFTIYLPASAKALPWEEKVSVSPRRGSETVLIIDDQETVLDISKEMVTLLGYRVFAARSGEEAIAVYEARQDAIDLVILDMIMPGMSGSETFDRLKRINPRIRVLLSSGYSLNGQAAEILARGCSGFIQKPFDLETLSTKLGEVMAEHLLTSDNR